MSRSPQEMDKEPIARRVFLPILVLFGTILLLPVEISARNILIYGPTLAPSILGFVVTEKTIAESDGHTVTVSNSGPSSVDWNVLTTEDFASFDAIVFADRGCADQPVLGPEIFNAAVANLSVWTAAIQGNIVIMGNSPVDRIRASGSSLPEAELLVRNALNFAASGNGTGLYMSLSCYYFLFTFEQQVDVLADFGEFRVFPGSQPAPGCPNTVTIDEPGHPVMAGLTEAGLSNWQCSMREYFTAFPGSYTVLTTESGRPYILATGDPRQLALLDPVPELLNGPQVTTDPALLATRGTIVEGVAADGVARVVVRIPAAEANEPFMLTLLNDSNNASLSVDEDGGLTTPGEDRNGAANMLFVSAVDTAAGPMAFVAYHAPIDFPRSNGSDNAAAQRSVKIRVQSLDSGGATNEVTVKIVRPLVLLVHGIWSSPTAWNHFEPLISDDRFFVRRANYEASNALGILRNALVLMLSSRVPASMNKFKATQAVAAVQFDAVAHSMGGDIIRAMIIVRDGLRNDNFALGDVHKLISLGTPHRGTPLANRLWNSSDFCRGEFAERGLVIGEGVFELQDNSQVLNNLAEQTLIPIPTHTMVGRASPQQTNTVNSNFGFLKRLACPNIMPSHKIQDVLGTPSDLLVPELSQAAFGLGFVSGSPPMTPLVNVVHTTNSSIYTLGPDELSRIPVGEGHQFTFTGIPGAVTDLLNQPVNSPAFLGIRP